MKNHERQVKTRSFIEQPELISLMLEVSNNTVQHRESPACDNAYIEEELRIFFQLESSLKTV